MNTAAPLGDGQIMTVGLYPKLLHLPHSGSKVATRYSLFTVPPVSAPASALAEVADT